VEVVEAFTPPIPGADASVDVLYADQVVEHMSGIDAARQWVAEALRLIRPGGTLFVVVPDYLKEREFFWDIDYTHNFITTERRMRQLLYDGGFEVTRMVRSIGLATGLRRDLLAGAAIAANIPGTDALSRWTGTEELLFKIRKNLFETLAFVARR
jgi:SAM-dependent methyltransferase